MAEEFQAGVCGGNWWNNSTRGGVFGTSPCSSVMISDIGSYGGWPSSTHDHLVMNNMKATKSSDESSDGSMVIFQDLEKPPPQSGGAAVDSTTLQIMGIGVSSSTTSTPTDWNQSLLRDGNYNYSEDSSIDAIKAVTNNHGYSLVHQPLNFITSSGDCTSTFPISANTSPYPSNYPSSLLQSLFDSNSPPEYNNGSMTYTNDYQTNLGDFSSTPMPKFHQPSLVRPKSELVCGGLHLSNNTPYWNASAVALNDIRASFFSSTQSQFMSSTYEEKPNCTNIVSSKDSSPSMKKSCSEPAFKRPRLETPSPLPTFKVRKEKLGDRVTALQQLVSPFGKTDTASVLHEAIEYIKLLHDQVNVLSTPYMKNGASMQRQQISEKVKDKEGSQQDLRSRGLCLVPVSSTFPVTTETTTDFWTPSFGGIFR